MATNENRLFLSFWDLRLDNLADGVFSKRRLAAVEARSLIASSRSARALLCVSGSDLLAPYKKRELRNHQQLCSVLAERHDIQIDVADFIGEDCANPLALAEVHGTDRLLVISCMYEMDPVKLKDGVDLAMSIAPDSIAFYLIEVASYTAR